MIEFSNDPAFDFGSTEYREFFSQFGLSPFQHPDWLEAFYRLLPAAAGKTPLILVGRQSETGQLRAVFPLLRDQGSDVTQVTFAFLGVTDYACPVMDPTGARQIALRKEMLRLIGQHVLTIAPVHSDHKNLWSEILGGPAVPLDLGSHAVGFNSTPDPLSGTGKVRMISGLRRKKRRLAELGDVWLDEVRGPDAREAILLARHLRAGRFDDDPLQFDETTAFYADVASRSALARTFRLMCGDQVAAIMFGLVHLKRFYYLLLACDYKRYAKYSPGLMVLDLAIQAWAEADGEVFDFTIGDEPFKARFGCSRLPVYSFTCG